MANETKKNSKSLLIVCVALLAAVVLAVVGFAGKSDLSKKLTAAEATIAEKFSTEEVNAKVEEATAPISEKLAAAEAAIAEKFSVEEVEAKIADATAPISEKLAAAEAAIAEKFSAEEVEAKIADATAPISEKLTEAEAKIAELFTAEDVEAKIADATAPISEKLTEAETKIAELFTAEDVEAKIADATAPFSEKLTEAEAKIAELFTAEDVEAKIAEATEGLFDEEAVAAKVAEAVAPLFTAEQMAEAKKEAVAAYAADWLPLSEAAVEGKLIVLHTNDTHGRAVTNDSQLGYATIAAMKKTLEDLGAKVLLLDAGDASQGTPIVNLSQGNSAVKFMNAAAYDAATLGNHEFDWGLDNILKNQEDAQFAYLCANIIFKDGGDTVFTPNKIYDFGSVKVGVFGLATPETSTKAHPDKVKGISFLQGEELYACAQAQVNELTEAGCNYIICLSHLGDDSESTPNRSIDLLEKVTGINLLIDGHSHTTIEYGEKDGATLRVSTGEYFEAIGFVIVNEDASVAGLYTLADQAYAPLAPDEEVKAIVDGVDAEVEAELSASFAKTEVLLNGERDPGNRTQETNLGDFATDAILWAAQQYFGNDVVAALTNGGGIRASIQIGDVTMKDMKTVFPFGNEVAVLTVKGSELLEALEAATCSTPKAIGAFPQVSGIVFTVDTSVEYVNGEQYPDSTYFAPANPGSRITIESVNGQPFDPEAEYRIATNDFTAAGGDTYYAFKYAYQQTGDKSGLALEDALVSFTSEVLGGVIGEAYAEPQGRITVK